MVRQHKAARTSSTSSTPSDRGLHSQQFDQGQWTASTRESIMYLQKTRATTQWRTSHRWKTAIRPWSCSEEQAHRIDMSQQGGVQESTTVNVSQQAHLLSGGKQPVDEL